MRAFDDEQGMRSERIDRVLQLQNIMRARATHKHQPGEEDDYVFIRESIMQDPDVKQRLPQAVRVCRSLDHFWEFIKPRYSSYAERREYLQRVFEPLLQYIEDESSNPVDELLGDVLQEFSAEAVQNMWGKAIERREADPAAAITLARSLIESVCKHIMNEAGEDQGNPDQLYRRTTALMNLAPNKQSEEPFRQLLGACNTIVGSLYAIRNRFGDAHGRSSSDTIPLPRHAELAVNVAGSLAVFLVRTNLEQSHTGDK